MQRTKLTSSPPPKSPITIGPTPADVLAAVQEAQQELTGVKPRAEAKLKSAYALMRELDIPRPPPPSRLPPPEIGTAGRRDKYGRPRRGRGRKAWVCIPGHRHPVVLNITEFWRYLLKRNYQLPPQDKLTDEEMFDVFIKTFPGARLRGGCDIKAYRRNFNTSLPPDAPPLSRFERRAAAAPGQPDIVLAVSPAGRTPRQVFPPLPPPPPPPPPKEPAQRIRFVRRQPWQRQFKKLEVE